jgi:hypothetical protein
MTKPRTRKQDSVVSLPLNAVLETVHQIAKLKRNAVSTVDLASKNVLSVFAAQRLGNYIPCANNISLITD